MIRTIITPDQQDISIKVPKEFIGLMVEIIAFKHEETADTLIPEVKIATQIVSEGVIVDAHE